MDVGPGQIVIIVMSFDDVAQGAGGQGLPSPPGRDFDAAPAANNSIVLLISTWSVQPPPATRKIQATTRASSRCGDLLPGDFARHRLDDDARRERL